MPLAYLKEYSASREVIDSWKSFWSTVGVVSALISTIAYSGLLAYPQSPKSPYTSDGDSLNYAYGVCVGGSFMLSLIAVLSSTLFYIQIDKVPAEDDLAFGFIADYEFVLGTMPVGSFLGSILLLMVSVLLWFMMLWGGILGVILFVIGIVLTGVLVFYYVTMDWQTTALQRQKAESVKKQSN